MKERAIKIENGKIVFANENGVSFATKTILKAFLKSLKKIARPLLVSVTAQIVIAVAQSEDAAESFLSDVLEEVDGKA